MRARRFLEPNQASWLLAVAATLRANADNASPSAFFQRRSRAPMPTVRLGCLREAGMLA